jgi:hypothetical protein
MGESMGRRECAALLAVVALGLLLRLAVALTPACIATDGVRYVELAGQIAAGGTWFHPVFPPGYSLLIALVSRVFGTPLEESACYLSAFSGALAAVPAWFIWRSIYGPLAAGFSCLLLAIWPLSVEFGGGVYTEPLSLLGIFAGLYAWLAHRRGAHWGWGSAAGLCWGGVAWMKPEILVLGGLAGVVLLRERRYRGGLSLLGVALLAYLPCILLVHEHTGSWKIAAKQDGNLLKAQALGEQDFAAEVERMWDKGMESGGDAPAPGAVAVAKNLGINLYLIHRYTLEQAWSPIFLALVAVGFFLAWQQRRCGAWLWLPAAAFVPVMFFVLDARMGYWLFASWLCLAGLALAHAAGSRRWLLVGLCLFFSLPEALRPLYRPGADEAERQAGLWLKKNPVAATVVMDRKPYVAYYSGLPQLWPLPQPGLEGLGRTLAAYESAVLVVDNRHFRISRPEWFSSLACPPPWLAELARFTGPDGHEVRLLSYRRETLP